MLKLAYVYDFKFLLGESTESAAGEGRGMPHMCFIFCVSSFAAGPVFGSGSAS